MEDIILFDVDVGLDQLFNCIDLNQSLGGVSSFGSYISYIWLSVDVLFEFGDIFIILLVDVFGEYVFQVINIVNICVDVDMVLVSQDIMVLMVNIVLLFFFICMDSLFLLDGFVFSGVFILVF